MTEYTNITIRRLLESWGPTHHEENSLVIAIEIASNRQWASLLGDGGYWLLPLERVRNIEVQELKRVAVALSKRGFILRKVNSRDPRLRTDHFSSGRARALAREGNLFFAQKEGEVLDHEA